MHTLNRSVGLLLGIVAIVFVSCGDTATEKDANTLVEKPIAANTETAVERGKYLVETIGCEDCHSAKKMGPKGPEVIEELKLAGYPQDRPVVRPDNGVIAKGWMVFSPDIVQSNGPWGVSFAANITSDSTGIGGWTEAQFIKCIKEGKLKGLDNTRPLLPPMPWPNFAKLKDDDLKAMYAYLMSTKPVKNIVPAALPPM